MLILSGAVSICASDDAVLVLCCTHCDAGVVRYRADWVDRLVDLR